MPDSIGSLAGRAACVACLLLAATVHAAAQQPFTITEAPTSAQFFSRFDFNMSAAKLADPDPRFSWDTHWAGDLDLVDYVHGRVSFLADYQALLGSEFRAFDPYQSSYTLEAMGSVRAGKTEFVGVLSHVSRHLGDRPKRVAVAENSLGLRVMRRMEARGTVFDVRGDVRKVIARAYVDYAWFGSADLIASRRVSPRTALYTRVFGQMTTVERSLLGRDPQPGGRFEGGVRLAGTGGIVELFAGAERVTDADQLDRQPQQWAFAGFRLLGK